MSGTRRAQGRGDAPVDGSGKQRRRFGPASAAGKHDPEDEIHISPLVCREIEGLEKVPAIDIGDKPQDGDRQEAVAPGDHDGQGRHDQRPEHRDADDALFGRELDPRAVGVGRRVPAHVAGGVEPELAEPNAGQGVLEEEADSRARGVRPERVALRQLRRRLRIETARRDGRASLDEKWQDDDARHADDHEGCQAGAPASRPDGRNHADRQGHHGAAAERHHRGHADDGCAGEPRESARPRAPRCEREGHRGRDGAEQAEVVRVRERAHGAIGGLAMPEQSAEQEVVRDPERHAHKCEDGCDDGAGHRQAQIRSPVERAEHRPRDRDEREPADQLQRLERRACRVLRVEGRHRLREADDDQSGVHHTHQGQHRRRLARPRDDLPDDDARDDRKDQDDEEPQRAEDGRLRQHDGECGRREADRRGDDRHRDRDKRDHRLERNALDRGRPEQRDRDQQPRRRRPVGSPLHAVECPRAAAPQGARRHRLDEADVRDRHHRIGSPTGRRVIIGRRRRRPAAGPLHGRPPRHARALTASARHRRPARSR